MSEITISIFKRISKSTMKETPSLNLNSGQTFLPGQIIIRQFYLTKNFPKRIGWSALIKCT